MTKKTEHDVATNTIVVREMTADELAQQKIDSAKWAQLEANIAKADIAKAAARQAVLDKLGLTQDEAEALLG